VEKAEQTVEEKKRHRKRTAVEVEMDAEEPDGVEKTKKKKKKRHEKEGGGGGGDDDDDDS
jgi:ribosomal RNA assembly protein